MFHSLSVANTSNHRASDRTVTQGKELSVSIHYVVALVLLSLFRLGGLTHQSLWFDEGYTLNLVSTSSFTQFLQVFGSYTTSEHLQPLYYFIMFAWSRVAGTSDIALRMPSALFSIGSGLYLFSILRRATRRINHANALIGIAFFSVCSYSIFYAQEARPYACIQFCSFAVMATWLTRMEQVPFHRMQEAQAGAWKDRLHFSLACALACLASIFGIVLVVSLASAEFYRRRHHLKAWWSVWRGPAFLATPIVVAYGLFARMQFPSVIAHDIVSVKQPLWMNGAYTIFGLLFGTTIGPNTTELRSGSKMQVVLHAWPILVPAVLVMLGLAFAAVRLLARSRSVPTTARISALAAVIYGILLVGCFGMIGHLNILPRHGSALFALLTFTLAICASSIPNQLRKRALIPRVMTVALAGAFLLNCVSVIRSVYSPACRKDDYRAVAATLPRDATPTFLSAGQTELLQHYGLHLHSAVDVDPSELPMYLLRSSGASSRIRIVTNTFRNYRWDHAATVEASLQPMYDCGREATYAYFEVLDCSLKQSNFKGTPTQVSYHAH